MQMQPARQVNLLAGPSKHLSINARPPEKFYQEVMAIESELDELAPGWRRPVNRKDGSMGLHGARDVDDPARMQRVVYLLNRRKHLYNNRDYGVRVLRTPRGMHVGATVFPSRQAIRHLQADEIARRLGAPVCEVAEVLQSMPAGLDPYTWSALKLGLAH